MKLNTPCVSNVASCMEEPGGRKMLSTLNRLTLVARHLARLPEAVITTHTKFDSRSVESFSTTHRRIMYRVEERGAPNTLEHRIFFSE